MSKMVTFKSHGNFKRTWKFLKFLSSRSYYRRIEKYAQKGVQALIEATPKNSGVTADSWGYDIKIDSESTVVTWTNSNATETGIPIVILLQYGHATKNGGYVQGFDFINPALEPIFKAMADDMWREVKSHE